MAIHASLLPNGKVLTWGQRNSQPEIWTPPATAGATGSFVSTSEPADLFCSGHTFLPDGRVLVAGGHSGTIGLGIRNTTIFNFATGTFTSGPLMQNGRWYPTNTALASGEVLTLSGGDTAQQRNLIPEVYQSNGTWRVLSTASLYLPYYPMAFVAPAGNVFVAGPSQTTYFLDPSGTGRWTGGPSSEFGVRDYGSAVMYDVGKIFMVGGGAPTATAEVIDISAGTGTWRYVAPMAVPRRQSNATILADGKVLVTGGTNATGFNSPPSNAAVLAAELWDPATEHWTDARSDGALPAVPLHCDSAAGWSRADGGQRSASGHGPHRRSHRRDLHATLPLQCRRHARHSARHHVGADDVGVQSAIHGSDACGHDDQQGHMDLAGIGHALVQPESARDEAHLHRFGNRPPSP